MQVLPEAALRTTLEDGHIRNGIPGQQLAERIAEGLRARGIDEAIWDVRWFKELPPEPYEADSYAHYPVIAV